MVFPSPSRIVSPSRVCAGPRDCGIGDMRRWVPATSNNVGVVSYHNLKCSSESYLWYSQGTEDAPVVAAMKSAGCILLGVTNVSELCMWMESNNKVTHCPE